MPSTYQLPITGMPLRRFMPCVNAKTSIAKNRWLIRLAKVEPFETQLNQQGAFFNVEAMNAQIITAGLPQNWFAMGELES